MPYAVAPAAAAGLEPLDGLLCRFWALVRADLAAGDPATAAWLDSDDFGWWVRTTLDSLDPNQLRHRLLAAVRRPVPPGPASPPAW
jgi:hypothetical protein